MGIKKKKLHIEELKNKFKNYKKITVDDFYEFYKDVFGEIKRSTVRWYIYELKNNNIIKNISRGQYKIEDPNEKILNEYIVITMDIVKSTNLHYNKFNDMLKNKIEKINNVIQNFYGYDRIYNISQGDEIQILIPFDRNLGNIIMLTLCYLVPFKSRYAISLGDFDDNIKRNSWDMNGPIFWNARDKLEKLKNSKKYDGLIVSGYDYVDKLCNDILPLINNTIDRITEKQWEVIRYELTKKEMEQALNEINIKKSSYYDRLQISNLEEILKSFKAIYEIMNKRRSVNQCLHQ